MIDKPHKVFGDNFEERALEQYYNALTQDFVVSGALMPDAHVGYTLPIGAVIATRDIVVPAYVGYDIGCGVCAYKTVYSKQDISENARAIFNQVNRYVPMGFNSHRKPQDEWASDFLNQDFTQISDQMRDAFDGKGVLQAGTLGGGNHFIELAYDEKETVWIIIHSGSRGMGHNVASHWMKVASKSDKAKEGYYGLSVSLSEEGKRYMADLDLCLKYALENRRLMILSVLRSLQYVFTKNKDLAYLIEKDLINRNHNHAEKKDDLIIHRKGATHAEKGMLGVIPGNMRDGSYIVEGLGNEESLCSSSHGAGRKCSRKQARKETTLEQFKESMEGIVAKINNKTLDESPFAYKDFESVMSHQKELITIKHKLIPIINWKG